MVGVFAMFGIGLIMIGMTIAIFKCAFVNRIKDLFWIDGTPFYGDQLENDLLRDDGQALLL